MSKNPVQELLAHLDVMGIGCEPGPDQASVVVTDPKALLDLLTDEEFIARQTPPAGGPPVPVHRSDNPVGALMEWCQGRGPTAKMPVFKQTDNIGTVHAPRFACTVLCDGQIAYAEEPNKMGAKRKAAMLMLQALARKYDSKDAPAEG